MKRILILTLGLLGVIAAVAPVAAQDAIAITASQFTGNFRKNLLFQVEAHSRAEITQVELLVQFDGNAGNFRGTAKFDEGKQIRAVYDWNLEQRYLPPGVSGQFWWEIADSAGNRRTSGKKPFRIEDQRVQWQSLVEPRLALYWSGGGADFGKAIFARAVSAMDALQKDTGVVVEHQLQIFLYDKRADFLGALEPVVNDWVGGRAYTDYGITLINVSADNLKYGLVATPHELTHLIIHRKLGNLGTVGLPRWFDEGLAMYYEFVPAALEPEYDRLLKRAIQDDTLLPLRTLSGNFATDARQAVLSYAQSFSVVDFIYRRYGKDKMAQLLSAFQRGDGADAVFRQVLGVDTEGLEAAWRQDIGAKPRAQVTRPVGAPTPFPTFGLSTDPTSTPGPRAVTPTAQPRVVTPTPLGAGRASDNPIGQLCGSAFGIVALGILGPALYRWRRGVR